MFQTVKHTLTAPLQPLSHPGLLYNCNLLTESEAMMKIEGQNQAHSCLPHRSEIMCTLAVSTLEDVCRNVCNGDITVGDIKKIENRKEHMEKLCSAVKSGDLDKLGEEYDFVKKAVEARMNEFKAFTTRKQLLGSLCQGVTIKVSGMSISFRC